EKLLSSPNKSSSDYFNSQGELVLHGLSEFEYSDVSTDFFDDDEDKDNEKSRVEEISDSDEDKDNEKSRVEEISNSDDNGAAENDDEGGVEKIAKTFDVKLQAPIKSWNIPFP